jgi:hypothetical protein
MKWVTRVSVVIGMIALVATVWWVGPGVLVTQIRAIGWFFIVIIALEILSSVVDATALYYMAYGPGHPSWRNAVVAQLAGRGVNSITPGGNLGEALKVGLLAKHCSPKRIVAAVMYVTLMMGVVSLGFIALGTAATAFWFHFTDVEIVLLLVGAAIAAVVGLGIYLLLRRGMLTTLVSALARAHLLSSKRRDRWNAQLAEVDQRLRGQDVEHRRKALVMIFISQIMQKAIGFLTIYCAGYTLSLGQLMALMSAGVLLGWIATIIPMGLGISEGGNVALFGLIGAPPALGLALSLTKRVNQVVFAVIGFVVLTGDRLGTHIHGRVRTRWPMKSIRPQEALGSSRNY